MHVDIVQNFKNENMKKSLLLILFSVCIYTAHAQFCQPDLTYADSAVGVYPLPEEGIDTACINAPYEMVFTAVVPNEITLDIGTFPLEWVRVDSIRGYPSGLDFACDPPDCLFLAETLGCLIVQGTPDDTNIAPADYPIVLSICAFAANLELCDTVPGDLLDVQYIIPLKAEGGCEETVSNNNLINPAFAIANSPNPFSEKTSIMVNASISDVVPFKVFDLMGKVVHSEMVSINHGANVIEFDGSNLSNGMYMYSIGEGKSVATQKMVVSK